MRSAFVLPAIVFLRLSAFPQDLSSARHASSLPSGPAVHASRDCSQPQLLAYGRPVMIPMRNGLAIGISLAQYEFKVAEPIELHIWIDNTGNAPAGVFTCMDLEHFKTNGIAILAHDGHRVLSRDAQKARGECSANPNGRVQWGGPWVCARNILLKIPAHTCITRNDYDFESDLTSRYDLPPGKYSIRLQTDWERGVDLCAHELSEPSRPRARDLNFTVTDQ
jgi:hypothetical protein